MLTIAQVETSRVCLSMALKAAVHDLQVVGAMLCTHDPMTHKHHARPDRLAIQPPTCVLRRMPVAPASHRTVLILITLHRQTFR